MSDLVEQVRRDGLLAEGRPVLVLLSGGRDSTCLLDVAVRIAGLALTMSARAFAAGDKMIDFNYKEAELAKVLGDYAKASGQNVSEWIRSTLDAATN